MIALGCDHGGYAMMQVIKRHLDERGLEYKDCGCFSEKSVDYPDYAQAVCREIQAGNCDKGILICGTGIGVCIAANKMRGIRAALCSDCYSAQKTREHNDSNVLTLGGRVIGPELALMIADIFLDTPFSGEERHKRRIEKLEKYYGE